MSKLNGLIILIIFFNTACNKVEGTEKNKNIKLQIYLFHPEKSCETCISMKTNMKKVLDSLYKDEVEKGIINFKEVIITDKDNKLLVDKYTVKKTSLRFIKIENGIENDVDLSEFAFDYSNVVPEYFIDKINDTIRYYIK